MFSVCQEIGSIELHFDNAIWATEEFGGDLKLVNNMKSSLLSLEIMLLYGIISRMHLEENLSGC